jgi:hypothetical protein
MMPTSNQAASFFRSSPLNYSYGSINTVPVHNYKEAQLPYTVNKTEEKEGNIKEKKNIENGKVPKIPLTERKVDKSGCAKNKYDRIEEETNTVRYHLEGMDG